jgi:hypothetical protein
MAAQKVATRPPARQCARGVSASYLSLSPVPPDGKESES